MAKPPPPPKRRTSELDEVERAISVLGGRHPEHERTRRETLAAAEARRKTLEKELADNARRRQRRVLIGAVNLVALAVAAAVVWKLAARTHRIREALARAEAPFLGQGATELASNQLTARSTLEVDVPASSCVFAIATQGTVVAHAGGSTLTGGLTLGFCTCAAGPVTLEASGAPDAPTGLALLHVDGKITGGPLARPWSTMRPDAWGSGGVECADAMLDAWIADRHGPRPALDDTALDALGGAQALRDQGFRITTKIAPGTPFAVVEGVAGDCQLVIANGAELSLRLVGGARPIEHARGALGWCSSLPEVTTVWASGAATGAGPAALVLSAPGARLGGLLGLREGAKDAGYALERGATWLRPEDQGWDATAILKASTLADVTAVALPSEPAAPDARAAAIVASAAAGVTWETREPVACDPELDTTGKVVEAVCIPGVAAALWRKNDGKGETRSETGASVARGALPLWMSVLGQRHEADAVARVPELLTLARRLTREGFEPTTFEGVIELREGVRVVGRAGEDTVVAVGLAPKAPWVFPYSDGIPWDLGDAPREVPLKPGATVTLTATPPPGIAFEKRRTVVFRRVARP